MKYCKDCKFCKPAGLFNKIYYCQRPLEYVDLVTGKRYDVILDCRTERDGNFEKACGPEGKFFEAK